MSEKTESRKSYEIATAMIHRKDGSCRRILKQKDMGDGIPIPMMDKFFLPGTFVDQDTGEVLSGPGECQRWTQAYTWREVVAIMANNLKMKLMPPTGELVRINDLPENTP